MPGKILTGGLPALSRPQAGFFGKLPCTGDFVSRGLPHRFRKHWDVWITRHLTGYLKDETVWPQAGLRFRVVSGGRVAAGVIVPGQDAASRRFPLSLILIGEAIPGSVGLDAWCDAALDAAKTAQDSATDADRLLDALDQIIVPEGAPCDDAAMLIWCKGKPAVGCDPSDPEAAIRQAFAPQNNAQTKVTDSD